MKIFPFQKCLSSKEMINFSGNEKHQDVAESIHKKNYLK